MKSYSTAAVALLLALGFGPRSRTDELPGIVSRILDRPELRTSLTGIAAVRVASGDLVLGHNAEKLFAPASNTKLVSCAGALAVLGKDFQFVTRLVATTEPREGVVDGDVVLVAVGDPNLSQRISPDGRLKFADKDHSYAGFFEAKLVPGDPLFVLRKLAHQARAHGLTSVRGDVVVDDGLFRETDDEFVGPISAACVNDNIVDVTVSPGSRPGEPARYEVQPRGSLVEVVSSVTTVAPGKELNVWVEARDGAAAFEVLGTIPQGASAVLRTAGFRNPALAAAGYLADALRDEGVRIEGKAKQRREGLAAYTAAIELGRHESAPLSEALRVTLKVSQNLHATMLLPVIGAWKGARGDRFAGYTAIREALEGLGLDLGSVVLWSGSGGGRGDHLTPAWLTQLLRTMARRDDFPIFLDMLPIGGVDGTLAGAFQDAELGRRVHAKTGTLVYRGAINSKWVYVSKALSGYLDLRPADASTPPRAEDFLAFSIIIANTLCDSREKGAETLFKVQEDVLRALLDHERAESRS